MYCRNCGTTVDGLANFCPSCGFSAATEPKKQEPERSCITESGEEVESIKPAKLGILSILYINRSIISIAVVLLCFMLARLPGEGWEYIYYVPVLIAASAPFYATKTAVSVIDWFGRAAIVLIAFISSTAVGMTLAVLIKEKPDVSFAAPVIVASMVIIWIYYNKLLKNRKFGQSVDVS